MRSISCFLPHQKIYILTKVLVIAGRRLALMCVLHADIITYYTDGSRTNQGRGIGFIITKNNNNTIIHKNLYKIPNYLCSQLHKLHLTTYGAGGPRPVRSYVTIRCTTSPILLLLWFLGLFSACPYR